MDDYDLLKEGSPEGGSRWADQVEELSPTLNALSAEMARTYLKASVDKPAGGNYFLDVSGLPGVASEDNLGWFFGEKGVDVIRIDITMKNGSNTGMALLEVADEDSYYAALKLDKSTFKGRPLKIQASSKKAAPSKKSDKDKGKKGDGKGDGKKSKGGGASSGGGGGSGGGFELRRAEEIPQRVTASSKGKKGKEEKGKGEGKGKGRKEEGKGKATEKVVDGITFSEGPAARPRLVLLPRSKPKEDETQPSEKPAVYENETPAPKPKTDPFGGAKPREDKIDPFGGAKPREDKPSRDSDRFAELKKDETKPSKSEEKKEEWEPKKESPRSSPAASPASSTWSRGSSKSRGKGKAAPKKEEYVWRVAGSEPAAERETKEEYSSSRGRGRGKRK